MTTGFEVHTHGDSQVVVWSNMKADSDGVQLPSVFLDVNTVSFSGHFDKAEVVIEGSAGGVFYPLETLKGGIVSSMSSGIENLHGRYMSIRPKIIGGTEDTNITIHLFCDTIKKRRLGK